MRFSQKWRKLQNKKFHTIRLKKTDYWIRRKGGREKVIVCGEFVGWAKITDVKLLRLKDIDEKLAKADADMTVEEIKKILSQYYKHRPQWDGENTLFVLVYMEWMKEA